MDGEVVRERQRLEESIYSFFVHGISIADIARQTGRTAAEVQEAISLARAARPHVERRENRLTGELHYAIAQKLAEDPAVIIKSVLLQADITKARQMDTISRGWMMHWQELLRGAIEDVKAAMLDVADDAEDRRQK